MALTAADAERLFESGKQSDIELLEAAEQGWPPDDDDLTSDLAEVARYARVTAWRQYRLGNQDLQTVNDWQGRHVAAASLTGNLRSLCLSLQPSFYMLVARKHFDQAHAVLEAMATIAAASAIDAPPTKRLIDRILVERRAFIYRSEERWGEAVECYRSALALTEAGTRGHGKVSGGLTLAKWLAGGPAEEAVTAFTALVDLSAPSQTGTTASSAGSSRKNDVFEAATTNLAAARANDPSATVPFDLV